MKHFFDTIVRYVLRNRKVILTVSMIVFLYGAYVTVTSPVDILPDLNRPTVTIFTEAQGLATEEVEVLVTRPIESVMNGATGVQRVRSISSSGLSLIFVEFDWGQNIFTARQMVAEQLQAVSLPEGVFSRLGPISSIMGEIQLVGIRSMSGKLSSMDLRNITDWTIRPKLLSIPGVAQVTVIGGQIQEYQIRIDPVKLANLRLTIEDVEQKLTSLVDNLSGGLITDDESEYPVRIIGRTKDIGVLGNAVITESEGTPILLNDIAIIDIGPQIAPRGDASINGTPGIIVSITKRPNANTLELTATLRETIIALSASLDPDIELVPDLFVQEKFIRTGIDNVLSSTRDAAIMVIIILLVFLGNLRALSITLLALPLSFIIAILILRLFDISINVMTLGGLAVAVGELTDDAVIGVENASRWLRENYHRSPEKRLSVFEIILRASSEVRGSVIFATVLVVIVFLPLFALSNIEGRLLAPLGFSYIIALLASAIVAVTVSVILSFYLLPGSKLVKHGLETGCVKWLKSVAEPIIRWSIKHPYNGIILAGISILLTGILMLQAGKEFLPAFNEGTLTIGITLRPGSSLAKSNELGSRIEKVILEVPGVTTTARRTGRAEEDEHANGVNISELEVDIDIEKRPKDMIIADIRKAIATIDTQEANISIGQPISHRIEHILSGVRAPLVVKVFGTDQQELEHIAETIRALLSEIPGTLNPLVEKEVSVPQITITPLRQRVAQYGLSFGELTDMLETLLAGKEIGRIIDGNASYRLTIRLQENDIASVDRLRALLIHTPKGTTITLAEIADIRLAEGQNSISHDNGQRRLVVSSGILGGDSVGIIETLKGRVAREITLPQGYFIEYEGSYKSQQDSSRRLMFFGILALIGVVTVLYWKFRSVSFVAQILVNVPVTYLGAMIGVFITGNIISLASLVGLISILGLAARNGILLIEHWLHMAVEEGMPFGEDLIVRGSLNRIVPMLMTSLTSILALIPLLTAADEPGKELLYPLAVTMFGGLIASTMVEILVRPGLFKLFGEKPILKAVALAHVNKSS